MIERKEIGENLNMVNEIVGIYKTLALDILVPEEQHSHGGGILSQFI